MLTRLGMALGTWKPGSGGGDPLATIRAAWTGLVGIEVARAAQPVAIANQTLVVLTNSSGWSHQLAFLEHHILRGLSELKLGTTIARLRFRVGTIRSPVSTAGRRVPAGRIGAASSSESSQTVPRDAAVALARFRAAVERRRAAHRARGGVFCCDCAAPIRAGRRCVPCADWAQAELTARCQRLLFDAPWLAPEEVFGMLPGLEAAAYDRIRRQLLQSWWDEMRMAEKRAALPRPIAPDRGRLRKIASSFVLLETKLDPNRLELDSAVRRNALGELYDFIRRIETHVAKP